MTNRLYYSILGMVILSVALIFIAALFSLVAPSRPSFTYDGFVGDTVLCIGEDLTGTVNGYTDGSPNITSIVETIYEGDTSQIAKRFQVGRPVTADQLEAMFFSFPLLVDLDGLGVGEYRYVRTSSQQLADGEPSLLAQLSIRFTIVECGE
jgi:hypothetical protein